MNDININDFDDLFEDGLLDGVIEDYLSEREQKIEKKKNRCEVMKLYPQRYANILCSGEFYKKCALYPKLGRTLYYNNIHLNPNTSKQILQVLKNNNYKRDKWKKKTKEEISAICVIDWMAYSPNLDEDVPGGEIWLMKGWDNG